MAVDPNRIDYLLEKFSANKVSEAEFDELCELIKRNENESVIKGRLQQGLSNAPYTRLEEAKMEMMLGKVVSISLKPVRKLDLWRRIAAAAIIVLVLGAGTWYTLLSNRKGNNVAITAPPVAADVKAPTDNHATITLANGKKVFLDSVHNGQLALQGNVKLLKLANGEIAYAALPLSSTQSNLTQGDIPNNVLTNPRGSRVIDMRLSDGSHVWLNAGSSITYPVAFVGNERRVFITGEAYFEVAHDVQKPFEVSASGVDVQVLGTHFNINAYSNEETVKTTLLEGKVRVKKNGNSAVLRAGEQVAATVAGGLFSAVRPNLNEVMAWKDGLFIMNKTTVAAIMKQVERWYDVEVMYPNGVPKGTISGEISRSLDLSDVLKVLEHSGLNCIIEHKKVIVK